VLLYQPKDGYCYNSDTHILLSFIANIFKKYKNLNKNIIDIGSGVGVLGLSLKRDFCKLKLSFSEIQNEFVNFLQINLNINKQQAYIFEGNFLDTYFEFKFDIVVSNPPFYDKNVLKTPNTNKKIARYNDNLPLNKLIKKSYDILTNDGKFIFCYDAKQIDDIFYLLMTNGFNIEVVQFVHAKKNTNAKLVLIYARKNSNSKTDILSPVVCFDNLGNTSDSMKYIYAKSNIHSIKATI